MATVNIEPMTRIEGHLGIKTIVEKGEVLEARVKETLFRGIELILKDREPAEASVITQRICGVCPASHAMAAALCLDDAFGLGGKIHKNARIIRNLILASNYLQSNILHFYHFAALDYVDITAAAKYRGGDPDLNALKGFIKRGVLEPFMPRYECGFKLPPDLNMNLAKNYIQAFNVRRNAHEMLAVFGGKMPHQCGIVAGGATVKPTMDKTLTFLNILRDVRNFVDEVYYRDVLTIAEYYKEYLDMGRGCGRFLSYGVFDLEDGNPDQVTRERFIKQGVLDRSGGALELETPDMAKITEDITYSWYDGKNNLNPYVGETIPNPQKEEGYSFIKSPRYGGEVVESGPIADVLINYAANRKTTRKLVDKVRKHLGMKNMDGFCSIMGRNIARMLETKLITDAMQGWVMELEPGEPIYTPYDNGRIPDEGEGFGITGAPRGALGHWLNIQNKQIKNYQIVTPTTWNASPRDANGVPGPMEQALTGLPIENEKTPIEIVRAIRSFDPCIACAAHVFKPSGAEIGEFRVL